MAKSQKSRVCGKQETWNAVRGRVLKAGGTMKGASAEWKRVKACGLKKPQKRRPPIQKKKKRGKVPDSLKPFAFKPGNTASVGHGRPKGSLSLTTLLRKALRADDMKHAREIIETCIIKAANGDYNFVKMFFERMDGKVPDKLIADVMASGPLGHTSPKEMDAILAARRAQKKREAENE